MKQTEKQFQEAVVEYAKLNGWLVYHTFDSRHSADGFPDLVLVRGDSLIFAELKTSKGKVSIAQERWLDALANVPLYTITGGGTYLWRPSEWPEIEEELGR